MKEIVNPVLRDPIGEGICPVWDENCEVLILGSITAVDGMRKGFLYASAKNQFWELLDISLGNEVNGKNSFTFLKNELRENYDKFASGDLCKEQFEKNKSAVRAKFAKALLSRKIALCDVVKRCYFNNNSSLDQDIIFKDERYPFESNKEMISHILKHSKIKKVIVNSRFVEKQFKDMKIEGDYEIRYVVSPSPRKGSIDKKIEQWKDVFSS